MGKIRLLAAALCESHHIQGRKFYIVNPIPPTLVPVSQRGQEPILFETPTMEALALVWGGVEGQKFQATISLTPPQGEARVEPKQARTRGSERVQRIVIPVPNEIMFTVSGTWWIRILIDGDPLAEMPLPLYWEDEYPPE